MSFALPMILSWCIIACIARNPRTRKGEDMTFEEVLDQAIAMLRRCGRLTCRPLQLHFQVAAGPGRRSPPGGEITGAAGRRASAPKPASCWPLFMAGSRRALTPPTSRRRRRCWQSWRENTGEDNLTPLHFAQLRHTLHDTRFSIPVLPATPLPADVKRARAPLPRLQGLRCI